MMKSPYPREEGGADFIVTLNSEDFPQNRLKARVV